MEFTHLHVHTQYSLLDGASKIDELIARTRELGMDSIAITDHGVMYGVIDFYREAKKAGVKPIIGCEVYVAPGSRFDRETGRGDERYYHLVLLAENDLGYHNLMKIVSKGHTEGFYYKPRVDMEILKEYHEGIICLSACLAGEVAVWMRRGMYDEAKKAALKYLDIFGEGNYFLEMQDHGIPEQADVNAGLLLLSKEIGVPLVATNDCHYVREEDWEPHDVLLCIQTGKKLNDENRMRYDGGQYYVKSPEEMEQLFSYCKEAVENTHKIAERCNVEIVFGEQKVPQYDVPAPYTAVSYLRHLCEEGIKKRYQPVTKELQERLDYELKTIEQMGYVDYFLIVWDFINYAKVNDIPVGPGRGSAAGSIVSYCLEITDIDPIRYSLLFERFLNPERVSMPDIDVDFCVDRRQEVIEYVTAKYGKEKVVQIVTFGTMAAKMVIRDVGRVLDLPYALCDQVAKCIPNELNITIEKALSMSPDLKRMYEDDANVKHLINMSKRLEGLPRHASMHAAGVVIGSKSIDEFVPLSKGSEDAIVTQFTMTTIEQLGLLKMDFLGLRNLTVIKHAVDAIYKNAGKKIDMMKIDYDDKKVFDLIASGRTEGIFQLESAGMKNFMKELKPVSLEDVIAGISLYRPGPMDFIPAYIHNKENPQDITYDCPQLEKILAPTYGCIVYQEQVMQIVMELAGYTLGRSDLVRRAMSKKKADVMAKERQNFVYGNEAEGVPGCISNGISEDVANKIFDEMTDFAKYAFNKSHAACYAVVAYQTAYLKCYYPVEYMAALMSSVINNTGKISSYILSCHQMGIEILPPDINAGASAFTAENDKMRYGLSALKSIGSNVINNIVTEREENGLFTSLQDFIERMSGKDINKRAIENFIKAGAFDSFQANRRQMMQVYAQILDQVNREKKTQMTGQMSLFDMMGMEEEDSNQFDIPYPDVPEFEKEVLLAYEKEVLGIYVSGHPLEEYEQLMAENITATSLDFVVDEETGLAKVYDQQEYLIGGMINQKTIKYTKNNDAMAFITLEDQLGSVEVIVFPRQYASVQFLNEDDKIFVRGRASVSDDEVKLICGKVIPFAKMPQELWLRFENKEKYQSVENTLYGILDTNPGEANVHIYLEEEKQHKQLAPSFDVSVDQAFLANLKDILGEKNVMIRVKRLEKPRGELR